MSDTTFDILLPILVKAARDFQFRDWLVTSPADAAQSEGVTLDKDDVDNFNKLRDSLLRFGGNPALHPEDAAAWAIGLLMPVNDAFNLNVLSWRNLVKP